MYKKPSFCLYSSYNEIIVFDSGGNKLFININIALSCFILIRCLIIATNCDNVISTGTRNLFFPMSDNKHPGDLNP